MFIVTKRMAMLTIRKLKLPLWVQSSPDLDLYKQKQL